jgi:hypothetical protein
MYNVRLLILTAIIASLSFFACKKDTADKTSSETELLSFGPTGAQPGDTIRFFGNNLNTVTDIEFTGATVSSSGFVSQSSKEILVVVPTETEKGYVTLKTPAGDITSKTQFNISVAAEVSSITAVARPGENVTIEGNYLNWVTSVTFNDGKVVTGFVSQSLNELVVTIPADAQTGTLVLAYGGTDSNFVETTDTLHVTLPVATSLSPNPIKHADELTITGTDLDLATEVIFTGAAAPVTTFVSQSATQIKVKVPGDAQTGKITLKALSGVTTTSGTDLTILMPAFATITPNPADATKDITITGTNLDLVTGIAFTGISDPVTSFKSQSATSIVVTVPDGTLKGKLVFSILNSSLTVTSDEVLDINGGLPPLADFPFAIYTDDLQNGFQNWSWAANDFYSTELVRQGDKSIKATYGVGGYEGITFHNGGADVSTSAYNKLELSMYGGAGTAGKMMNIVINGNYGSPYQVALTEGEWSTYDIDISALGSPNPLNEIVLQSAGWSGVVFIDHVGLR